jgi:hypothetical protein
MYVTGSERFRACLRNHVPRSTLRMFNSFRFCFSLAFESFLKEASHRRHNLKIAVAAGSFVTILQGFALAMEHLFSPCTRYRDLMESQDRVPPEWLRELNLDVSTDEFLSADRGFTYADLYAMLGNGDTIAWLTPHVAIAGTDGRAMHYWGQLYECRFCFTVDGNGNKIVAWTGSSEALSHIVDVLLRFLAVSVVHSVIL